MYASPPASSPSLLRHGCRVVERSFGARNAQRFVLGEEPLDNRNVGVFASANAHAASARSTIAAGSTVGGSVP